MSDTQMIIRLDANTKLKLARLAKSEGKNTSVVVRELIDNYVLERDITLHINDLWSRVGKKMKTKRISQKAINKAIKDVRKSR